MKNSDNTSIAGATTVGDWLAFRESLTGSAEQPVWEAAFENFFRQRLKLRYLDPINVINTIGEKNGEGFSIVAIQCTLIEFLESTAQGLNYRFLQKGERTGTHEYSSSRKMFVAFLRDRKPFSDIFDATSALDFYTGVRCGLLHEAQTKNGWRILAKSCNSVIADVERRIVYRDDFQCGLLEYIDLYKRRLLSEEALQSAFLRKFDDLCKFSDAS